jgi:hypothetical protein
MLGFSFAANAGDDHQGTSLMSTIEARADAFESNFLAGLASSTVNLQDRDRYRVWVNRFEVSIDRASKADIRDDKTAVRKNLVDAMEAAVNIDHFMLHSKWNEESESSWRTLRADLNALAAHHELPPLSENLRASR